MKKYLLCIVITILFVACDSTNDLGTPFTKGQEVTLTAVIGEQRPQLLPGKQRVSGKDSGTEINLKWDEGDQIKVIVGDKSAIFTLTSGAGSSDGTFTGIMPADGTSFHVEYPIDYSDDVLKVQQYVPNGFGKGLMKMSTKKAGTLNNGFTLSADNALLGLQLTGNRKIGKIVLSRNNSAGKVGDESYTLLCPNVMLSVTPTLFYIVVLPGTWANGFTVEVIANDNSIVIDRFVKTSSITFGTDMATIMPEKNVQNPPKRIGVFSVGNGKYVSFSQGNLQYIQSTNTWQFAENQWEILGEENKTGERLDLFDWSTDEAGNFVDWGMNIIQSDSPKTWRTLSIDEWKYILHDRPNATSLLACAIIDNVVGVVVLPENWQCPEGVQISTVADETYTWDDNIKMYHFIDNVFKHNTIEPTTWQTLEKAGAVFLPTAGFIKEGVLTSCGTVARTWSATRHRTAKGYYISFGYSPTHDYSIRTYSNLNSDDGHSVRLVHDTIPLN